MVGEGQGRDVVPEWMVNGGDDSVKDDWEGERSWRDPSVHKLRGIVARFGDD